jgi:hypothetical protein
MTRTRAFILLFYTVFIFIFLVFGRVPAYETEAQTAPEKTVGQTHPNVKLLKDLPESQLFITMNFMRASLGVSCAYCHVNSGGDKWEWAKDDKPTKMTALKHIQMTMDMNKANFEGRPVITCNTCHQGQPKPAALPLLPQAPPEGGPAGLKPEVALPTVDQVLDKYIQALGGRGALEKVKTRVMKGSQAGFDGTTLPLEIYREAPNKFLSSMTRPQGLVMQGYNGTVGWLKNPRGQRELSGEDLAAVKRRAEFHENLKLRELYPDLKITAREKAGDREAFVLESEAGKTEINRLFFDAQTGLLLRRQTISKNILAPIPDQVDFEDYRDVDGVKLPFTIRQSFVDPWIGWTQKFTEIKQNIPIEAGKFDLPK